MWHFGKLHLVSSLTQRAERLLLLVSGDAHFIKYLFTFHLFLNAHLVFSLDLLSDNESNPLSLLLDIKLDGTWRLFEFLIDLVIDPLLHRIIISKCLKTLFTHLILYHNLNLLRKLINCLLHQYVWSWCLRDHLPKHTSL